jgi:hypothetical protein
MAELSPAAQAVLDAALGEAGPAFEPLVRVMAAAALRAAVDQVIPERVNRGLPGIRAEIIAIATELENHGA